MILGDAVSLLTAVLPEVTSEAGCINDSLHPDAVRSARELA
jgi:hypothetical protein